ncbi:MAG: divalent-cation tolerance protein CutA [Halobacteriaceae archaeon]
MAYLAVAIGVPGEAQAHALSRLLVEEQVAAGTRLSSGISHYRWDGDVREAYYWTITAFTTDQHLDGIRTLVRERHDDELPGITWQELDAPDEYLTWIDEQTR